MVKREFNPLPDDFKKMLHPTLNEGLIVDKLSVGSGKKLWWLCLNNHPFAARVNDFVAGHGCPYCSNNKVFAGFNDLATVYPLIAAEWHPMKNGELTPSEVIGGSSKKRWWLAACNHEWEATVASRCKLGHGCPYCAGQKILQGFNDLATTHPDVTKFWHPTKNGTLTPEQVTAGVNRKVWWVCVEGHETFSTISGKTAGLKCRFCAGSEVLPGFNDLKTTHPDILAMWDYEKNTIDPTTIFAASTIKVWWKCDYGHSYETRVRNVTSGKSGCQFCAGVKILEGFNNLAITHPLIAAEWDFERNAETDFSLISKGATGKFWWVCKTHNHSFQSRVGDRVAGSQCNICSNLVLKQGFNDLATTHPLAAAEWHPTKNGTLTPEQVTAGVSRKVWWLCVKGHEWETLIPSRKAGSGCPTCLSTNFASKAETEIAHIVESFGFTVVRNRRNILKGSELDIYIPEKNVAIEYNGLFWHTENHKGKHKNYHYDKWLACKNAGITLFTVWEDDWLFRKNIVIRSLAHKLGVTHKLSELYPEMSGVDERIFGRKTVIVDVPKNDVETFLNANHIQGFVSGSYYVGLKTRTGDLCAVMVIKKQAGNVLNIVRYATQGNVVGGFTKILKHVAAVYQPDSFITFADHCVSDGGLYENNGFVVDAELKPDYMYVVGKQRKHKFGYRLKKFKNSPNLLWKEGYTESELAALNNLPRIWDAGKTRYRLDVKIELDDRNM